MKEVEFKTIDKRSGAEEYVTLKQLADGDTFDIKYNQYRWFQLVGQDENGKDVYVEVS